MNLAKENMIYLNKGKIFISEPQTKKLLIKRKGRLLFIFSRRPFPMFLIFFIYSSFVTLRIAGSNVLIFCSFPDQIRQLVLHFHPGSHLEGMRQGHLTGSLSPVRHWLHTLPGCSLPDRMFRYLHCMPDLRLVRMRSRALLQVPIVDTHNIILSSLSFCYNFVAFLLPNYYHHIFLENHLVINGSLSLVRR